MAEGRKYDIVVFGASGFTGKHVVEEIARTASEEKGLKWAIAGRNMKSLQGVLDLVSKVTGKSESVISNLDLFVYWYGISEASDFLKFCWKI